MPSHDISNGQGSPAVNRSLDNGRGLQSASPRIGNGQKVGQPNDHPTNAETIPYSSLDGASGNDSAKFENVNADTSTPLKSPLQNQVPRNPPTPLNDTSSVGETNATPQLPSTKDSKAPLKGGDPSIQSTPKSERIPRKQKRARAAEEAVRVESEKLKLPEGQAMTLVGVMMKEATIDSPGFRASTNFVETQFNSVEKWIDSFLLRSENLVKGLEDVREKVNSIISLFMPDFAFTNILSEDYTSLAFGRYTQSMHLFWVAILSELQTHHKVVVEKLTSTKTNGLQIYQAARKRFLNAQRNYDEIHARHMALSPETPEVEVAQSALRTWEARKLHLEAAYNLCLTISKTEALITVSVIEALTHPFQIRRKSFMLLDQERIDIGIDMHRLSSVAAHMRSSLPQIEADLHRLKKQMLAQFMRMSPAPAPGSDPNSTIHSVSSIRPANSDGSAGKFGWVYVRRESTPTWTRLWAFVQSGYLGFLGVSSDGLFVQESKKYPVKSLRVSLPTPEPRRFVFMIDGQNIQRTLIQAKNEADLQSWLDALEPTRPIVALPEALLRPWSATFALKLGNGPVDKAIDDVGDILAPPPALDENTVAANVSQNQLHPTRSKVALKKSNSMPEGTNGTAAATAGEVTKVFSSIAANSDDGSSHVEFIEAEFAGKVQKRLGEMQTAYSSPSGIIHSSSLSLDDMVAPTPAILATKPLPTSKSLESVVANWYLRPHDVPNAITSNFWGTVNWVTFNHAAEHENGDPGATNPLTGIKYPAYYPKKLVLQDGDMRSVLEGLANPNPASEDLLMMVLRCMAKVGKDRQMPSRIYITSRKMYIYGAWQGLVGLQKYDLDSILEVECSSGVDFDELRIVISMDPDPVLLIFRLYIDNGLLAKQRLDFLVTNLRSKRPLPTQSVQESLVIIGGEFAHAKEQVIANSQQGTDGIDMSAAASSLAKMDSFSSSKASDRDASNSEEGWLKGFLWRQLKLPGSSSIDVSSPKRPYQDSTWKLIESTFTVKPRILFIVAFGNRSDVFKNAGVPIVKSNDTQVLPWYQQGKKLQRHVVIKINEDITANNQGLKFLRDDLKKDHIEIQTVVKADENQTYIVEEKHPYIQMPDMSVFNVTVRYIIYSTDSGSQLQIWSRINWKKEGRGKPDLAQGLVYEMSKSRARDTLVRVRESVKQLGDPRSVGFDDVVKKFGRVKATAKPPPDLKQVPETVTTVRQTSLLALAFLKPFQFSFDICHLVVVDSFVYLSQLPLWRLSIVGFLIFSVLLNLVLATRSTFAFWKAYWTDHNDQKQLDHLGLFAPQQMISKRSLLISDLDDAIRNGTLFNPQEDISPSSCGSKFTQLVYMANSHDDEPYFIVEPQSMDFLEEIDDIRTKWGLERAKLATRMRVLNVQEKEELLDTYSRFLIKEISMCSRTREKLVTLNASVFEGIQDYCLSCLHAASRDLL